MYRVIAKSTGKYGNVKLGARYCFRKKSAAELVALFAGDNCDFVVEQLIRIHGDVFSWTNNDISEKIWEMAGKMLDKSEQK